MKKFWVYLSIATISLSFFISSCSDSSTYKKKLFLLTEGNFWNYHGSFNGKTLNVRMQVMKVMKDGEVTFALMKGFPSDVMEGENWEAGLWGLIAVNGHYYRVTGSRVDSIRNKLLDTTGVHSGLVTDADLFMTALYDTGQVYGEASQLTRADGNYFWKVSERKAWEASSIKGLKVSGTFDRFTLNFRTVPDETIIEMVPGVGIVRYQYCHHGTPAELDMKLVEAEIK